MKKLFIVLLVSLGCASCAHIETRRVSRGTHPVLEILREFQPVEERNFIIPYSINLMALHNLETGKNIQPVREYMDWYLAHVNYPDKTGLTGTMYDLHIGPYAQEEFTDTYDSVDSYSATFLMVVHRYYRRTGDKQFLTDNREKLQDIAYTIAFLQDKDGLVIAAPAARVKFLMDNCEDYGGITAFIAMAHDMNWPLWKYYQDIQQNLRKSILRHLYDSERNNFFWALDEAGVKSPSTLDTFYPDAYAQLFPVLYGLLDDNSELRDHLWQTFNQRYGATADGLPIEQKLVYEFTRNMVNNENHAGIRNPS